MIKQAFIRSLFYSFIIFMVFQLDSCSSNDIPTVVDCATSDIAIQVAQFSNPSTCNATDGSISVTASGGDEPYQFALNDGAYGSSLTFSALGGGNYTVKVKDKNDCERTTTVTLTTPGSTLSATTAVVTDNQCLTNNGSITVNATGGTAPYQYRLGTDTFGNVASFTNLRDGTYVVSIRDNTGCTITASAVVERGDTGTSFTNNVSQVITSRCATSSCHGGGQSPNFSSFANIKSNASNIRNRVQAGSMPPAGSTALTADQRAVIICWIEDGAKEN